MVAALRNGLKAIALTAASWGSNRIDVFRLGPSAELQHKWWAGAWGGSW